MYYAVLYIYSQKDKEAENTGWGFYLSLFYNFAVLLDYMKK